MRKEDNLIERFPVDRVFKARRPWAGKYAAIYGIWNLMSEDWNNANVTGYSSSEDVYKSCIEKGVTWQELLNYNERDSRDVIL